MSVKQPRFFCLPTSSFLCFLVSFFLISPPLMYGEFPLIRCAFFPQCCSIQCLYRSSLAVMHTILIRVCKKEMMYVLSALCSLTDFKTLLITEVMTDVLLTNGIRRCLQIHQPSSIDLTLSTHFERTIRVISI